MGGAPKNFSVKLTFDMGKAGQKEFRQIIRGVPDFEAAFQTAAQNYILHLGIEASTPKNSHRRTKGTTHKYKGPANPSKSELEKRGFDAYKKATGHTQLEIVGQEGFVIA